MRCCKPARLLYLLELRRKFKNFKPVFINTGEIVHKFLLSCEAHLKGHYYDISLNPVHWLFVLAGFALKITRKKLKRTEIQSSSPFPLVGTISPKVQSHHSGFSVNIRIVLFFRLFLKEITDCVCLGCFFSCWQIMTFAKLLVSFKTYCIPELKTEKIFHLWFFFVKTKRGCEGLHQLG